MPRELPNTRPVAPKKPTNTCENHKPVPPLPTIGEVPGYIPVRQQTDYSDLKLKTLAENVAKLYVPYALKDTRDIDELTVDNLSNEAYLYVDDNGKPSKILAVTVLRKEISWDDLSDDIKQQLQAIAQTSNLEAGRHITIENNKINADIGVETINGRTGNVYLSAGDIGALPIGTSIPHRTSELINDSNFVTSADISSALDITVDGGKIE